MPQHNTWNASKTHCPHGHAYTPANTYRRTVEVKGRGYVLRECRACGAQKTRSRYAAQCAARARAARRAGKGAA
jgi:hypothetical protein